MSSSRAAPTQRPARRAWPPTTPAQLPLRPRSAPVTKFAARPGMVPIRSCAFQAIRLRRTASTTRATRPAIAWRAGNGTLTRITNVNVPTFAHRIMLLLHHRRMIIRQRAARQLTRGIVQAAITIQTTETNAQRPVAGWDMPQRHWGQAQSRRVPRRRSKGPPVGRRGRRPHHSIRRGR